MEAERPAEGGLARHGALVEVYSSPSARACKHRALVLQARNIPFVRLQRPGLHVIAVEERFVEVATAELASYEAENRDWPPRDVLPRPMPGYIEGTLTALLVIVLCYGLQASRALGVDWLQAGAADTAAIRSGQVWRTVTSLTLHTGPPHLLSNLIFGALFGFLVAYGHGGGLGWLAILVSGALGNLVSSLLQGPTHLAVGASTAVFAAVGILAGSEWRRRNLLRERWVRRSAPIVMALCILAMYGGARAVPSGDYGLPTLERIDVVAHVTGLVAGLLIGPLLPYLLAHGAARRSTQLALGLLALALLLVSWILAFEAARNPA